MEGRGLSEALINSVSKPQNAGTPQRREFKKLVEQNSPQLFLSILATVGIKLKRFGLDLLLCSKTQPAVVYSASSDVVCGSSGAHLCDSVSGVEKLFRTTESYRVEGSQPETLSRTKNTTLDLHLVEMNPNKSDTPLLTKHSCSTAEPSVSSSARRGSLHGRVTGGGGMEPPSTAARRWRNHNSLDLR